LKILTSLTPYFFTPKKYKEFQAMTKNNIRHIPKLFRKELRYLAKYSGIHFLKLAELHTFSDYFNYTERFLCSAFAVNNKKSVERKIIVGRNLDYFIPFLKDLTVIHIFEKGKKRYLSIGFLGILGVYSGMNKDGLTISNLLALNPKSIPRNDGIPSSFLYRKILQTSKSAKSAIRMIKNTYKPFANNIVIADAKQVYIVEAYGDIIRVRKFRKGFLFTTNYFLSKDIRSKKHIGMRYKALKKAAKSIKKVDVEIMKNILHRAKLEFMTIHSIIFIPQDKNIYFSYGKIPSTKGPYILLTKLLENKNLNTKSPSF
jgi:predicted choloylglycine hydrolase